LCCISTRIQESFTQILIDPGTLLEALFHRGSAVGSLDEPWSILQSRQYLRGYLSARGLDIIRADVYRWGGCAVADKVIAELRSTVGICPIDRTVMTKARTSQIIDFNYAVEVASASAMHLDAILTQQPRCFKGSGLPILSISGLSDIRELKRQAAQAASPVILIGGLFDLAHLERLLVDFQCCRTSFTQSVYLSQWLRNIYDPDWQPIEELLVVRKPTANFRTSEPFAGTRRGKLLDLGDTPDSKIALLVELEPLSVTEIDIRLEICAIGYQTQLPQSLELLVLDETGMPVMKAQPNDDVSIVLRLSGIPGESFDVRVTLNEISITETFMV
jgi:hypothetical protein